MLVRLLAACAAVVLLASCTSDAPSRDDAVGVLEDRCDVQVGALARLPRPDDVFQLSEVAQDAFATLSRTISDLDAEDLQTMDDQAVERYLRGAIAANNAMGDVARTSGFEDVRGLRRAVAAGRDAGDDLDDAAEALGLPGRCGLRGWGGLLFARAAAVAAAEVDAMTPIGDLVDDVSTYCARYERSVRRAPDPGEPTEDRAWAFAVRHAVTLFGERLADLEPTAAQQGAFEALTGAVDDTAAILEPAETYAIDGKVDELQDVVEEARAGLRRVDALVLSLGADC